ncbi:MAG: hypothetical protein Aurels2KO_25260 [Aureliella sp.]
MALRIREIAGSESGGESFEAANEKRSFLVWDTDPSVEPAILDMRSLVLSHPRCPATVANLTLDSLDREYDEEGNKWVWTAGYTLRIAESSLRWSFDTQGGTVRITHSKSTTRYPSNAANFNGGIGYSNGEMQGVDVVIPALKLSATYRWPKNTFTTTSANSLATMSGTINSASWYSYAAGELLFLGATGEIVPGHPTEVTYNFAASANATGLTIGSISGIAKKGHEYMWVLYEDDEDSTAKKLVKKPLAAYVERVYTETAFSALGLGG